MVALAPHSSSTHPIFDFVMPPFAPSRNINSKARMILVACVIIANVFNVLVIGRNAWPNRRSAAMSHDVFLGRDYPQNLPLHEFDPVFLSMDHTSAQYPIKGNATDLEWLMLTSGNIGWSRLGDSGRLIRPSFYHEIHCLRMLSLALSRVSGPYTTMDHSRHCLHYLRNMALCSSDLTLEPMARFGDDVFTWDATQASHTCRDWTAVYSFMDRNQAAWAAHPQDHVA